MDGILNDLEEHAPQGLKAPARELLRAGLQEMARDRLSTGGRTARGGGVMSRMRRVTAGAPGFVRFDAPHAMVTPRMLAQVGESTAAFDEFFPERLVRLDLQPMSDTAGAISESLGQRLPNLLDPSAQDFDFQPDESWRPVSRLALTQWLSDWSPMPVPEEALTIDIAIADLRAGRPYAAAMLMDESVAHLAALLEWASQRVLPATVRFEIGSAANSAIEVLGPAAPGGPRPPKGGEPACGIRTGHGSRADRAA